MALVRRKLQEVILALSVTGFIQMLLKQLSVAAEKNHSLSAFIAETSCGLENLLMSIAANFMEDFLKEDE